MFNEVEIKKECAKYNFKYKIINEYTVRIKSLKDTWYIKDVGGIKPYLLMHCNKGVYANHEHKQRKFYDVPFLLQSIYQHDQYKINNSYKKMWRIKELYESL